jgi:hypothetical protein
LAEEAGLGRPQKDGLQAGMSQGWAQGGSAVTKGTGQGRAV